eukprot:snap_masked-scaffold_32-processed-gene-2.10-mRNA-1 protein AED:1.00 eAED:1.00 QI:0/0/0/0/1/1/2/0/361
MPSKHSLFCYSYLVEQITSGNLILPLPEKARKELRANENSQVRNNICKHLKSSRKVSKLKLISCKQVPVLLNSKNELEEKILLFKSSRKHLRKLKAENLEKRERLRVRDKLEKMRMIEDDKRLELLKLFLSKTAFRVISKNFVSWRKLTRNYINMRKIIRRKNFQLLHSSFRFWKLYIQNKKQKHRKKIVKVQAFSRFIISRTNFKTMKKKNDAAKLVTRFFFSFIAKKQLLKLSEKKELDEKMIQGHLRKLGLTGVKLVFFEWKAYLLKHRKLRKIAFSLQGSSLQVFLRIWRKTVSSQKIRRETEAVKLIKKIYLSYHQRKVFTSILRKRTCAAVKIQSTWRGVEGRVVFRTKLKQKSK